MPKQSYKRYIRWPVRGLDENWAYAFQPKSSQQQAGDTTPDLKNVRGYDPGTGRLRGAQRPGLTRYVNAQHSGSNFIQNINHVTVSKAYSGTSNISSRTITACAVANGNVSKVTTSAITGATSGSGALSSTVPVIFSAEVFGKLYFADGTNAKQWDAATNTVSAWTANSGSLPTNGANLPRLIETWRGRIVLAGLHGDEHNWFMSASGAPLDWDYSSTTKGATIAIAGNNSDAGKVGDVINCLISWSDDLLIFGGDNTIWQMTGDPALGGQIDKVTDVTGIAWGRPYCRAPGGILYFFGSTGAVYVMTISDDGGIVQLPKRISQAIEERLATVNLDTSIVRMEWDNRQQGVCLFITPLDGSATTNFFYDQRNRAWYLDVHADANHNPIATHVFDGDDPNDRVVLLGGQDGFIRKIDISAANDDATAIDSYCLFGPLEFENAMNAAILKELQAVLGNGSADVTWEVFAGDSAEDAFNETIVSCGGAWSADRNASDRCRVSGDVLYLKVSNSTVSEKWSIESIAAVLRQTGRIFQRAV